MSVLKPTLLGLGLAVAVAAAAQAQGVNIANVPAEGPRASSHGYQGPQQAATVAPSPVYPGPAAGAGNGVMQKPFEKPAGYDQNPMLNPYSTGNGGPRPN
jgi:hypothetical protein